MTIREILRKHHKIEIDLLLSHILGKSREFLFVNPQVNLTSKQYNNLTNLIKRRLKGEPIAYIFGYKDFYGLRFKVNRDVLIPRPETEWVVDAVIERLKDSKFKDFGGKIRILDVGTGSGCIAISLAKAINQGLRIKDKGLAFYASDISAKALRVARRNAKAYGARVEFVQSDLLKKIKFNPHIIIANLPYGWSEWKNNTSAETIGLKFEPKQALFTKERGLYYINQLLKQLAARAGKPRFVYLEFDPRQKFELLRVIKSSLPKADIKFYRDLNGLWRYVQIALRRN